jgi:polyisoprenoid-binding protein YceI
MTTYEIDTSHSSIAFTVRHLVISKVRGHFARWTGLIRYDDEDPTRSAIEVTIDAASITTGDEKRDGHLRSPDFLDVDQHPALTFKSRRIARGPGGFQVTGELTIHGVAREVVLEVEDLGSVKDPWGNQRIAFAASTRIDRKDFGLAWNQVLETGGLLVGERLDIAIDVEAVRQAAEAAA